MLEGRSWVNQGQNSDMGEGGIKNGQKIFNVFYRRPLYDKIAVANWIKKVDNIR